MALFNLDRVAKVVRDQFGLTKKATNDDRPDAEPRRGLFQFFNRTVNKRQQKVFTINADTLERLANADPITFTIRRTLKSFVDQANWDIVIDLEDVEAEIKRWEDCALSHLSPYAYGELSDFQSAFLSNELKTEISSRLKAIMAEPTAMFEKKRAVNWYFESVVRRLRGEAESHRHAVKQILQSPSPRGMERTFRDLMELVVDDILIFDAGTIVKNYSKSGDLAELYTLPGKQIRRYVNHDRTIPEPPEAAFAWEEGGILRAEFTRDELCYIMQNPQSNFYGKSPVEISAYVIAASLYADEYNIDYFKNSNVPPGVFDLGKDVTEDQRSVFQALWENEVRGRGGLHKMMFISGSEDPKFIPISNMTNRDMQMMEYLKWTAGIRLSCFGLSLQDIGFTQDFHRTTSETQSAISQARGVQSLLSLLEQKLNSEIVKTEFPFTDVKFKWADVNTVDEKQESEIDSSDLQHGVITINERRKKLGLAPMDGGNVATIAVATVVPVIDLEKNESGQRDIEEQATADEQIGGQPKNLSESPTPGTNDPKPDAPILSDTDTTAKPYDAAEKDGEVTVKVDRSKTLVKQQESIQKVIDELRNHGIDATVKIAFERTQG